MPETEMSAAQTALRSVLGHYRTERHNLARDFFGPCLASFSRYRRAVGFFSSSALRTWAGCLARLATEKDAHIQLLISPKLSEKDARTFAQTVNPIEREQILASSVDDFVRAVFVFQQSTESDLSDKLRSQLLAWLIVQKRIDIRFVINLVDDQELGMFHKKIGIFEYPFGDTLAFTGSANESTTAHEVNSESIEVYRSWNVYEQERIKTKIDEFEEVWNSQCSNLKVLPLSQKALLCIETVASEYALERLAKKNQEALQSESLWLHQEIALKEFLQRGHGVFEMATGTGKTRTALACASALKKSKSIKSLIVTMEGTDLLKQWFIDLSRWAPQNGFNRIYRHFENFHDREDYLLEPTGSILLISRSVLPEVFRQLRKSASVETLIIHDEVHDLGSPTGVRDLAGQGNLFPHRLGLSATPERIYDALGSAFIEKEIGPIIFRFGLEEAIRARILCPLQYVPLLYRLTPEDKLDLQKVYQREAAAKSAGNPWTSEKRWMELSRVYKKALEKLPIFDRYLDSVSPDFLKSAILFVEDRDYADSLYSIVHRRTHRFSSYYAEDYASVLGRFVAGELDCLITCHKISQGIDIPSLEKVVLFASSQSRLETIQRLGRCLRTSKAFPNKVATVVDFILADETGNPDPKGVDFERFTWFQQIASIRP